jgi:RNA polymerase sigma-70 factor (ECF subfamily)
LVSDDDDNDLYRRWAEGDVNAGQDLVEHHLLYIGRFFANKVADPADTEDLVGQTFEIVAKNLGKFRGDSSFRTYLFGISRNVLRDYIKKKGRRPGDVDFEVTKIADIGPSPSVVMAERKEQALLLQALRTIALSYQIVLELSFFESMTQAEIAEQLGIAPGTVASRIRRGKKQLYDQLELLADSRELLESTKSNLQDWAESIRKLLEDSEDERPESENAERDD